MKTKSACKIILSFLNKRGGSWTTTKKNPYRELLRVAPIDGANEQIVKEAVGACVSRGQIQLVGGETTGFRIT